jgi:hypothetical protein
LRFDRCCSTDACVSAFRDLLSGDVILARFCGLQCEISAGRFPWLPGVGLLTLLPRTLHMRQTGSVIISAHYYFQTNQFSLAQFDTYCDDCDAPEELSTAVKSEVDACTVKLHSNQRSRVLTVPSPYRRQTASQTLSRSCGTELFESSRVDAYSPFNLLQMMSLLQQQQSAGTPLPPPH